MAAQNSDRDSGASDIATIAAPMIDFYIQQSAKAIAKMLSPDPPKLHVRSLETPELPACTRLRKMGVRIADMTWVGNFPGHTNAICAHCKNFGQRSQNNWMDTQSRRRRPTSEH